MGQTASLYGQLAVRKIKELAEKASTCLFITNLTQLPLAGRPMHTLLVDDDGHIWFFSRMDSHVNDHIQTDNRVQLFYANASYAEYLSLYGTAKIIKDPEKARQLWESAAQIWFDGPEDPQLSLVKVTPEQGHYWDTASNRLVSMLKIVAGTITGQQLDDGIEGDLKPGKPQGNA